MKIKMHKAILFIQMALQKKFIFNKADVPAFSSGL